MCLELLLGFIFTLLFQMPNLLTVGSCWNEVLKMETIAHLHSYQSMLLLNGVGKSFTMLNVTYSIHSLRMFPLLYFTIGTSLVPSFALSVNTYG